ncbi:MAG: ABC transporter substrate-binding protein, partial [Actinomycetota bacterium]
YSGAADRLGLTPDHISLCGHAALIYGSVFNITREDLNVYWQMVNDSPGKVHGRTVSIDWKDDRYEGTEAKTKVKECIQQNPFFILGGIGFDQIPFAREEAETGKTLYLHHMAIRSGLERAVHSFSLQPTVEQVGTAFGEHIRSKYAGRKVGIIYRDTDYFRPGHDTGVAAMQSRVNIVKDIDTDKNQHQYPLEIGQLQDAGAEVVWIWESALAAAEIIQQAAAQGFRPKWVVFPFQLILDVVGKDVSLNPTIDGVGTWPAYRPGGYGNAFSQYDYSAEIRRFEEAMQRYRPGTEPNDILWQVWIGSKALHNMLTLCGRDCTRNKIAGMFLGGLKARANPNCEANFAHPASMRGRVGLHQFVVLETFDNGADAAFKTTSWCREHLG